MPADTAGASVFDAPSTRSGAAAGASPVALVTGGKRRLGQAIALELARGGYRIALHCHGQRELAAGALAALRALGVEAEAWEADLGDEAATEALVPQVLAHFGRLDVVVNNASVFEHDEVSSFRGDVLMHHLRVNTVAPILLARALHAHVAARSGRGCVVNLLDQKLWNPNPDHLSYTLSKAALEQSTTLLAMSLAPAVRVCGVAPGVTLPSGPMTEAEFAAAHRMTPLGKSSVPEDIARAVRFLAEAPAVTGTTLLVDGGQHLTGQRRDVYYLIDRDRTEPAR